MPWPGSTAIKTWNACWPITGWPFPTCPGCGPSWTSWAIPKPTFPSSTSPGPTGRPRRPGPPPPLHLFRVLASPPFRLFSDRPVDVAVVEVGLGGRWDATNVADGVVSVITNVGPDHVGFLGDTGAA